MPVTFIFAALRIEIGHGLRMPRFPFVLALLLTACGAAARGDSQGESAGQDCAAVDPRPVDQGLLSMQSTIARVDPLRQKPIGKYPVVHYIGATVYLRATEGTTAPWLELVLACHKEHLGVRGIGTAADPLALPGTEVSVSELENGFAVQISSDDSVAADEILRRSQLLASAGH